MSFAEHLADGPGSPEPERPARDVPTGWSPGYEWDGTRGTITTGALAEQPRTWDAFLIDAGLDPADVEVVEPVVVRGWDATQRAIDPDTGKRINTTVRMHGYRLTVRRRGTVTDVDELLKRVKRFKGRTHRATGDHTYIVALGDLQMGKIDGDGPRGTMDRVVEGIDLAAGRLRHIRRSTPVGTIHLAWLGDCSEGFVSQGGDSSWRTGLPLTEQVRVVRRLMEYAVTQLAPLAERVTQVAIPGNHDQAVRFGKGGVTRFDDSHDVEAMVALADGLQHNPAAFGHVQTHTPNRDELTVTLETSGTILGHAHGHMWRPGKHWDWWQGQTFGEQVVGRADVLLTAHGHHLHVEQRGARTFIMAPALESESTWWRHRTGQTGAPGVLTFTTNAGRISNLNT